MLKDWKKRDDKRVFGNRYRISWTRKSDHAADTRWLVVSSVNNYHDLEEPIWIVSYRTDILKRFTTKTKALAYAKAYMRKN